MNARDQIKTMLATRAMTMKTLAQKMSQMSGKEYSLSNLSGKLTRNLLRYSEMQLICDILNYDINFNDNLKIQNVKT